MRSSRASIVNTKAACVPSLIHLHRVSPGHLSSSLCGSPTPGEQIYSRSHGLRHSRPVKFRVNKSWEYTLDVQRCTVCAPQCSASPHRTVTQKRLRDGGGSGRQPEWLGSWLVLDAFDFGLFLCERQA